MLWMISYCVLIQDYIECMSSEPLWKIYLYDNKHFLIAFWNELKTSLKLSDILLRTHSFTIRYYAETIHVINREIVWAFYSIWWVIQWSFRVLSLSREKRYYSSWDIACVRNNRETCGRLRTAATHPSISWWRLNWKHFPRCWLVVSANSPHKSQWRGALIVSLICACTTSCVNNRDTGDLRVLSGSHSMGWCPMQGFTSPRPELVLVKL